MRAKALTQLADLAPTLRERELRVLLAMTNAFASSEHQSGRLSAAQLVKLTGLSRSNVFLAIASLRDRSMIATRGGTATEASGYKLTFTRAITITGSPGLGPPPILKKDEGGLTTRPQAVLFQDQGGPIPGPPLTKEHTRAGMSIDSITSDSIIDRLLRADPKNCAREDLDQTRRWVHGYQCKLGRDPNPHPPDDKILAQLIAVAQPGQIIRLIQDLMAERKEPGHQYSWYVTVALQRIHGIRPELLKQRRAELRIVRSRQPLDVPPTQQQLPDPDFPSELIQTVAAATRRLK